MMPGLVATLGLLLLGVVVCRPVDVDDVDLGDLPVLSPDLYQGDIVLEEGQERNGLVDKSRRWPGGVIPYVITRSMLNRKDLLSAAMSHYHRNTCIRFVKKTNETSYIRFYEGLGCYSSWGRTGKAQTVSLGLGCQNIGTILHELGHVVGFEHEHSRSDRDDYLNIHWDNIMEGAEDQFAKLSPEDNWLITPFDYRSVMLYGQGAFSRDGRSKTMTPVEAGAVMLDVHNKFELSEYDIERINTLYECPK
ncbi:MEP1B [Cordylochernes scorpioides]|uniref:Metalloendopeptidase n=1 Tax=Cordylochernes scorpioides TaxID=51811 RepID=A0ABY6L726_9ARAC|nr:MEP1B [Cordylochernes scorpioides]